MSASHHIPRLAGIGLIVAVIGLIGVAAAGAVGGTATDTSDPADTHPASSGEAISQLALSTDAGGVALGAEISTLASGGASRAGQEAPGADSIAAAKVPTPNEGGTATANLASDGAAAVGTAIADDDSQGRSAAGSGNASH